MASVSDRIYQLSLRIDNLRAQIVGNDSASLIYAAFGDFIRFGCKVTEGADPDDMTIALEGQATGDEANWNPDGSLTPIRNYEYLNIASLKAVAFYNQDLTALVEDPPASSLGRYDVAYIFVGVQGAGFAVATGTPSTDTKTDFDTNGLNTDPYDPLIDPALPIGALPVARIYIDDSVLGIPNSRIADIRQILDRAKGDPGPPGADGPPGAGLIIKGSVATTGDLPGGAAIGDGYMVEEFDPFRLYVWDGSAYFDAGVIQGPQGDTGASGAPGAAGADGASAFVYIAYASDDTGTDFTLTFDPALDYIAILSTTTEIVSPVVGDFVGLWKNYKGEQGTGLLILGSVPTVGDLPVGANPGDGWLVESFDPPHLHVWTGSAWFDAGPIASASAFLRYDINNQGLTSTEKENALTNLGAFDVGQNFVQLANPGAVSFVRINADNSLTTRSASDFRTDLGGTTVGQNLFTLANPSASVFIRTNADNTIAVRTASQFRTDLGGTTIGQSLFTLTNPSAITFPRMNADNTVTAQTAANYRTDLGGTTVGQNLFTAANPSAVTFVRINADNTISTLSASAFLTAIGGAPRDDSTVTTGSITGTFNIDCSNGINALTMTGSTAFTLTNMATGRSTTVEITPSGGTITFSGTIAWIGGAPTLTTSGTHVFTFWNSGGTNRGAYVGVL